MKKEHQRFISTVKYLHFAKITSWNGWKTDPSRHYCRPISWCNTWTGSNRTISSDFFLYTKSSAKTCAKSVFPKLAITFCLINCVFLFFLSNLSSFQRSFHVRESRFSVFFFSVVARKPEKLLYCFVTSQASFFLESKIQKYCQNVHLEQSCSSNTSGSKQTPTKKEPQPRTTWRKAITAVFCLYLPGDSSNTGERR